ncbi:FAD-dependent oxidoreductase [Streptomyces sp. NPDC091287]|uniref:FAD-dependent oxidoreductase n=1 Tax=Streptomyces sp. NPDC091287 TaxID=3365988 RepID=UPI00380356BC
MQHIPILVIGGGIGGMTTALALARQGLDVHIVEQAPEFTEIGAGLQLAPNALRVLERLGVLPELAKHAVRPRNVVFLHADTGQHLTTIDLGEPFRQRYGHAYTVLHRSDLLNILLRACQDDARVTLESGRQMVEVHDRGDTAEVVFADGEVYRTSALVGADGLWSRTRALLSEDRPVSDHYVAYRGLLPMDQITIPVQLDDEIIWIGPGKHLVQYPISGGQNYNQVAVFHSRAFRPEIEFTEDWGTPAELDERFASSCDQVRSAVKLVNRDRRWVMYDREPLQNWTRGRITLLGDAAHPMVQYLAQGACQAIEDADCLARQLAEHPGDVPRALAAYQAERIPRTSRIQRVARDWGHVWHADEGVVPQLRDRVFTRRPNDDYTDLDWLYQPVAH